MTTRKQVIWKCVGACTGLEGARRIAGRTVVSQTDLTEFVVRPGVLYCVGILYPTTRTVRPHVPRAPRRFQGVCPMESARNTYCVFRNRLRCGPRYSPIHAIVVIKE